MATRIMAAVYNGGLNMATVERGINWASRLDGSIVGMGVVNESIWVPAPAPTLGGAGLSGVATMQREDALRAKADERIAQSLAKLEEHCRQAGIAYRQVQETGKPHEEIVTEAQRHDLILMSKHETSDPSIGVLTQSILDNVLRNSPRPIVIVPDQAAQDGRGIMVAYDGSLQAARALQALIASGLSAISAVKVLSVDNKSEETAKEHASRAVDYLAAHGIEAESHSEVTGRSVEDVIVDEACRQGVEMLVMGAYGRSRLAEFVLGSVTAHVMDNSPIPVFLFH